MSAAGVPKPADTRPTKSDTSALPENTNGEGAAAASPNATAAAKLKGQFNVLKGKVAANAAALNEQMAKNAAQLREGLGDLYSDDDDEESSEDDEYEDTLFGDNLTGTSAPSTAAATAISIRNQPPPSFISLEEEQEIKDQLKAVKELRKRLRKVRKMTKSSLKHTQVAVVRMERLVAGLKAVTDGPCTDAGIQRLATTSEANVKAFEQEGVYNTYKQRMNNNITDQLKPLTDHAKYLMIVGKERRQARDRRIRLEQGELDVANEAAYQRSVDIVKDFDEKRAAYRDELRSLTEHNSSIVGQMLKSLLTDSADYYERLASVLRASADSVAADPNKFMSDAAFAKFKDYEPPKAQSVFSGPRFFSPGNGGAPAAPGVTDEDRLTAKPAPRLRDDVVTGVPMVPTASAPPDESPYSTTAYTRTASSGPDNARPVSRTRRAVENLLNTGTLVRNHSARSPHNESTPFTAADIRELEEMYGIPWPVSPPEPADEEVRSESCRSRTPTGASILPSIVRRKSSSC